MCAFASKALLINLKSIHVPSIPCGICLYLVAAFGLDIEVLSHLADGHLLYTS